MVCVGVSAYVVVCGSGGRIPLLKKEEIVLLPSMPHVKIPLPSPPTEVRLVLDSVTFSQGKASPHWNMGTEQC